MSDCIDALRALLAAGWVIVPPEPNPRMIGAAEMIIRANYDDGRDDRIQAAIVADALWAIMLRYAARAGVDALSVLEREKDR